MYTIKNTTNGQTTTCTDADHVRRIIENLHRKGVNLMTIEVTNGTNVWLAYEF